MKLKADEVSASSFLYNVRHTYEEDNSYILPYRHKYEFYINVNHEVSGRFIISVTTPSGSSAHTWFCETGGEIYNNQIMDRSVGTTVFVTGQDYLKVTLMYLTDSPIDILQVRSIIFSQTDLDGNPITSDQSMWAEVQKIEDSTIQILQEVGYITGDVTNIRTTLQAINTLITTTNTSLSTLVTTARNILTKVTNIETVINTLDTQLDTISWNNYTTPSAIKYSFDGSTYTSYSSGDILFTNTGKIYLQLTSQAYRYTRLYKLVLPFYYYNSANNGGFKLITVDPAVGTTTQTVTSFYFTGATEQLVIYFSVDSSINASSIYIEFESEVKKGSLSARGSMSLQYIDQTDIEYWQLMSIMKQYNYYESQLKDNKTIIELLREFINGNTTTNNSVDNNDQSNTQFQQQTQQYDQIESTFQSSFTTDQQAVQQTFNNNTLTIFADTTLWFTQQLNALYNASGDMKILFTLPLLLGLALFFIGRGAKTSSPNTIDSYYSSEMVANDDGVKYYHVRRSSNAHKVYHSLGKKRS
jgi:hypothetical protein